MAPLLVCAFAAIRASARLTVGEPAAELPSELPTDFPTTSQVGPDFASAAHYNTF